MIDRNALAEFNDALPGRTARNSCSPASHKKGERALDAHGGGFGIRRPPVSGTPRFMPPTETPAWRPPDCSRWITSDRSTGNFNADARVPPTTTTPSSGRPAPLRNKPDRHTR